MYMCIHLYTNAYTSTHTGMHVDMNTYIHIQMHTSFNKIKKTNELRQNRPVCESL